MFAFGSIWIFCMLTTMLASHHKLTSHINSVVCFRFSANANKLRAFCFFVGRRQCMSCSLLIGVTIEHTLTSYLHRIAWTTYLKSSTHLMCAQCALVYGIRFQLFQKLHELFSTPRTHIHNIACSILLKHFDY